MSCIYKSILLIISALAWPQMGFAEGLKNKMTAENHSRYGTLKKEADGGSSGACYSLAKLYEKYDQNAEAFKYWECALRKIDPDRPASVARHLAGHYFYGIGVEANVEQAAMYYILSAQGVNRLGRWPHMEYRNIKSHFHPYYEIIDIPDIEEKFKAGAELAKENMEIHEISDTSINSRLAAILHRIKTAKDGTWVLGKLYLWLALIGFTIFITIFFNVIRKRQAS